MAPWWLREGNDLTASEFEEVDAAIDAAPAVDSAAIQDPASESGSREAGPEAAATRAPDDEAESPEAPTEEATQSRRKRRRRRRKPKHAEEIRSADPQPASRPAQEILASPAASPAAPAPVPAIEVEQEASLEVLRGMVYPLPDRGQSISDERKIAMLCDFENVALGVRASDTKLDINLILARLVEKGKIIVKKAYADWERYSDYKKPFHEAAIELIDIPQKYYSGKNSADIKMVVDAMDLCYSKEHLDTFVLVSGDSDFSPLVSKLKENNKYVIGVGVKNSSSSLLIDNCDEFIYYEDLWRDKQRGSRPEGLSKKDAEVFSLLSDAMLALSRENKDVLWGSMIKQTMQRKRPSFNEGYYGYSTFSELLEDAQRKGIIGLKRDQRSGNYVVTGFPKR